MKSAMRHILPTIELKSVKTKLIIMISLAMIAVVAVISWFNYFSNLSYIDTKLKTQDLPTLADAIASNIRNKTFPFIYGAVAMSNDTFVLEWIENGEDITSPAFFEYAKRMRDTFKANTSFFGSIKTLRFYSESKIESSLDVNGRDRWVLEAQNSPKDFVLNLDLDRSNKDALTLFVNHKVYDRQGNFVGVMGLGANMDILISFIESQKLGKRGQNFIVDERGLILVHTDKSLILQKHLNELPHFSTIAPALMSQEDNMMSYVDSNGQEKLVFATRLPTLGWILISEIDVKEAHAPVQSNLYETLVYSFLFIILGNVLTYFMAQYFQKNIIKLQRGIVDFFAYLRYERDEVRAISLRSSDELGEMARVINDNILRTKSTQYQDREAILQVQEVIKRVNVGDFSLSVDATPANPQVTHLITLINEMKEALHTLLNTSCAALGQFASGDFTHRIDSEGYEGEAKELFYGISTLGATMSSMLQTEANIANTLTQKSLTQKDSMDALFSSIQTQTHELIEATHGITQVTQSMHEVNAKVSGVIEQSEEIKNIASIIKNIADQTNLLALNAAIEAARAGEHGRGFAVVADEVRKLAESTQKSLSQIESTANALAQSIIEMGDVVQSQTDSIEHISEVGNAIAQSAKENMQVIQTTQGIAKEIDNIAISIKSEIESKKFL